MKKNSWIAVNSHPDLLVGQYIVPNFVSNSIALQIATQEFVIISPGAPLLDNWPAKWKNEDTIMHIVMPNSFHYFGVHAWQQAFPNHFLYASKKAIPRLTKKGIIGEVLALEETQPPLPEQYDFLFPPGHRAHDTWLRKRNDDGTSLWITCDSFLNYERLSHQPVAKFMQKILGAAPDLKISQVIKWLVLNNRTSFKAWALSQLEQDRPNMLIPCHGEVRAEDDLSLALKILIESRL